MNETQPSRAAAGHHDAGAETMVAVVQERYGVDPAEVLRVARVPRPTIGPDEVLVQVATAGVDRGVAHLMTGRPYVVRLAGYGIRRPKQVVAGLDLAGTVVGVGDEVTRFDVGDEVLGIGVGTYAELAVARESKLVHRPGSVPVDAAGVLAISGLTALQAVRDQAQVRAGESVLVLGASGGVGSYVVQIARAVGAQVTGVASGAKLDAVRALGAQHTIDYTVDDIDVSGSAYDVVIDIGGNRSLRSLRRVLRPEGRLVIVGGENGGRWTGGAGRQLRAMLMSPFVSQTLRAFISSESHDDMAELVAMVERGEVTPLVDTVFELDDVAGALEHVMAGRATGKVAVRVRG